jgi:uncharacterized protein
MADITPLVKAGAQIIQSYEAARLQISGHFCALPCVVTPNQVLPWLDLPANITDWRLTDFAVFEQLAIKPDIILLGTGAAQIFLPKNLRHALLAQNLVVETMSNGAASRTYNVLMAEDRLVAAGFMA